MSAGGEGRRCCCERVHRARGFRFPSVVLAVFPARWGRAGFAEFAEFGLAMERASIHQGLARGSRCPEI